jgi:iron only hydrogenase large subunit-like protein
MSHGAGEAYKGYFIKTVARAVNPTSRVSVLFEGSAAVSQDPAASYEDITPESHLGEDQVFGTEFEAHRHAERTARKFIDRVRHAKG